MQNSRRLLISSQEYKDADEKLSGVNPIHVIRNYAITRHVPDSTMRVELSGETRDDRSMTSDKYRLNCLVEGDKNVFPILISRDAYIDHLTDIIYEKRRKGLFRDIDPADLTLLKVCNFVPH